MEKEEKELTFEESLERLENIVKKLENEGYAIGYGKFEWWERVPYVALQNNKKVYIAGIIRQGSNDCGLQTEFKYLDVKDCIQSVEKKEKLALGKEANYWNSALEANIIFSVGEYLDAKQLV